MHLKAVNKIENEKKTHTQQNRKMKMNTKKSYLVLNQAYANENGRKVLFFVVVAVDYYSFFCIHVRLDSENLLSKMDSHLVQSIVFKMPLMCVPYTLVFVCVHAAVSNTSVQGVAVAVAKHESSQISRTNGILFFIRKTKIPSMIFLSSGVSNTHTHFVDVV